MEGKCPSPSDIEAFVNGEPLDDSILELIASHLRDCQQCKAWYQIFVETKAIRESKDPLIITELKAQRPEEIPEEIQEFIKSLEEEKNPILRKAKGICLLFIRNFLPNELKFFDMAWTALKDWPSPVLPSQFQTANVLGLADSDTEARELDTPRVIASIVGTLKESSLENDSTIVYTKMIHSLRRNHASHVTVANLREFLHSLDKLD